MKNRSFSFLKLSAFAAAFVPALPLCAEDENGEFSVSEDSSSVAEISDWKMSCGIDAVYAQAQKSLFYYHHWEKTDLYGANFRVGWKKEESLAESAPLFPELSLLGGFAMGNSENPPWLIQLSVGANLYWRPVDALSVYAGARLGGGMIYVNDGSEDDHASGLLYGIGGGIVFHFNENNSVALGVEYVSLNAETEISDGAETIENPNPEYLIFTLGYRISF